MSSKDLDDMGEEQTPEELSLEERLRKLSSDKREHLEKTLDSIDDLFFAERKSLADASQASMASYDKAVLTVSAAALALSTRFSAPFVPWQLTILLLSWGFLLAAILVTVWSLKKSADGIQEWLPMLQEKRNYDLEQAELRHVGLDSSKGVLPAPEMLEPRTLQLVRRLNWFSFVSFILGLVGILVYQLLPAFLEG